LSDLPPVYYTPKQLRPFYGKGWSTRRVREWLKRAGVLEDRFGTPVVTAERLASAFPEVYRRLVLRSE
jgi:hypothetical protein